MVSLRYLCDLWSLHTSKTLLNSFTRHGLLTERFYISIRSFESGKWSIDTTHWCRYSVWDSVHDGFLLAWFPGLSS